MLDIFSHTDTAESNNTSKLLQIGSFSFSIPSNVHDVVAAVADGNVVHWVSRGQWSAIDMLLAVLNTSELPASIYLSSYAFSERPARIIANLISEGRIKWLRCIIDSRVDVRSQTALQLIKGCADKLKLVDTHAKVTVVKMGEIFYTIVGSANYTGNKRFEAGIISTSPALALFHINWIEDAIESDK